MRLNVLLLSLALGTAANAQIIKPHPRVILGGTTLVADSNFLAQNDYQILRNENIRQADRLLGAQPRQYQIIEGSLLTVSRDVLANTLTLSMAYRLTGNEMYSQRAKVELLNAAGFPDWFPGHFLGTAEMTAAMGIGYDWLYPTLTEAERTKIRYAIVMKGLQPGMNEFTGGSDWARGSHNWTQVCSSGLTLGALAVYDEEPQLAAKIINFSTKAAARTIKDYKPSGMPSEGPVYWRYGMNFHTMMSRSLELSFGANRCILKDKIYAETNKYPLIIQGSTGMNFNFGDASSSFYAPIASLELSRIHNQPSIASWATQAAVQTATSQFEWSEENRLMPLFVAWYSAPGIARTTELPLDNGYTGQQSVVTLRGKWNDSNASFVAIKAGTNGTPHGQLDLGSFVYEAGGVRWAIDLGKDKYSLPGYFDVANGGRWKIFRNQTAAHNTLTFGTPNQSPTGRSTMAKVLSGQNPVVNVSLTAAYPRAAKSIARTFLFKNREDLMITDSVDNSVNAWRWAMLTRASIENSGRTAILKQDGKTLKVEIAEGAGQFAVVAATPYTTAENQNEGVQMLTIQMPKGSSKLKVNLSLVR